MIQTTLTSWWIVPFRCKSIIAGASTGGRISIRAMYYQDGPSTDAVDSCSLENQWRCDHLIVQAWWGHRSHHPSVLPETNAGNRALTVDKIFAESGVFCDYYDGTLGWYTTVIRCLPAEDTSPMHYESLIAVPGMYKYQYESTAANNAERLNVCLANTSLELKSLHYFRLSPRLVIWIYLLTFFLAFDNMADLRRVSILCTANLPASLMSMTPNLEI